MVSDRLIPTVSDAPQPVGVIAGPQPKQVTMAAAMMMVLVILQGLY